MPQQKISLAELVNLEDWQKIQDSFSESLGITLRTIGTNSEPLSRISGPAQLCNKIPKGASFHSEFCSEYLLEANDKKIGITEKLNLKCYLDLDAFVLPIRAFGKQIVAYIIMGPLILNKRKEASEYTKYAREVGISPEELMDALIEINVFSHNKIRSVNTLLTDIFSYMAKTGYHKKRLGEIGQEVVEIDPLFLTYHEEKVLSALLKLCTLTMDADSGSVMTVDKKTEHLHIKVAAKLDERVVDNANVKVGEGIAGMAAANAEPIILPKDMAKNNLATKMKRDYIKSSMIVPFSKANNPDIYGVININVVRKEREFSKKDIAVVRELANLASIALLPVKD